MSGAKFDRILAHIDFMTRHRTDTHAALIELEKHMVNAEIDRLRAMRDLIRAIGTSATAERFGVSARTVRRWRESASREIGQKMSA